MNQREVHETIHPKTETFPGQDLSGISDVLSCRLFITESLLELAETFHKPEANGCIFGSKNGGEETRIYAASCL